MISSRRDFIKGSLATNVALASISGSLPILSDTARAATPSFRVGSITGNELSGYIRFAKWFGRRPKLALLAFNQTNATELANSIPWICNQGAMFAAAGAQILWSVPCPGSRQLEAISAGSFETLYTRLFRSILNVSPRDDSPILVRLPWEFNLAWQENAALDKNGKVNTTVFVNAWRRIATIAKGMSPRFLRIWCPNVTTQSLDPIKCWPGFQFVEIVSQDFYMQTAWNKPGDLGWFLKEPRGLQWGADFAKFYKKPYAISELGMDSDIFAADLNALSTWLRGLTNVHHIAWWDRPEVIDSRISDGTHPMIGKAFRNQFF